MKRKDEIDYLIEKIQEMLYEECEDSDLSEKQAEVLEGILREWAKERG